MERSDNTLMGSGGLARRLRAIRLDASLSGKELADQLGWQASKVSRLETGKQRATLDDLAAWVSACHASGEVLEELTRLLGDAEALHLDWRRRLQNGQAPVQAGYGELEQASQLIRYFELTYVPGLLQTAPYARAILGLGAEVDGSGVADLDAAVSARLQRQHLLYSSEKEFDFLVAEPALRWLFCPKEVMLGQLDRLQTVIDLPRINFGILPLGVPIATAPRNSFQIFDDITITESFAGEIAYQGERADVFPRVFDTLWSSAKVGDEARRLIVDISNNLRVSPN